jgi:hypothetical protein
MNRTDIGFISILGLVSRPILDENIIPILLILYSMYCKFENSIHICNSLYFMAQEK